MEGVDHSTVTVDPVSSPDHDKLGEELSKVKCLLGGGGTHRTYKDGTKPYYKRAHAAPTRIGRREMRRLTSTRIQMATVKGAEGDFRVGEEDVTQNCMSVNVSGMGVEVEVNERQSHCV